MSFWRRPTFDREPHPVLLPEETFNLTPSLWLQRSHTFVRCYLWVLYSWVAACLQHLLVLESQSQGSCQGEEWRKKDSRKEPQSVRKRELGVKGKGEGEYLMTPSWEELRRCCKHTGMQCTHYVTNEWCYDGNCRRKQTNKWWASTN